MELDRGDFFAKSAVPFLPVKLHLGQLGHRSG
jgi:hypothetical protein